jgi:hypothetical protein
MPEACSEGAALGARDSTACSRFRYGSLCDGAWAFGVPRARSSRNGITDSSSWSTPTWTPSTARLAVSGLREDDVEDLVQEVLVVLARRLSDIEVDKE